MKKPKIEWYILGIDPDTSLHSCALLHPNGCLSLFLDRTNTHYTHTKEQRIVAALNPIKRIVHGIENYMIHYSYFMVYLEHQNMVQADRQKKVRKQDITDLAHVTGIWTGMLSGVLDIPHQNIKLIHARTWKGNQPKWVNQRRSLDALNIPYRKKGGKAPYPVPAMDMSDYYMFSPEKPNPGDYKDINDSIGLALYGRKQDAINKPKR